MRKSSARAGCAPGWRSAPASAALTWPSVRARATSCGTGRCAGSALDPIVDRPVGIVAAAARQEIDAQLLEIAREAGGQQPLPLVGGNEARDLLLRPVEAERLAEPGVGAGQRELVELLARGERGDAEHAVELVTAGRARGRCPRWRRARSAGRGGRRLRCGPRRGSAWSPQPRSCARRARAGRTSC